MTNYTRYDFAKTLINFCLFIVYFTIGWNYGHNNYTYLHVMLYIGTCCIIGTIIGIFINMHMAKKENKRRQNFIEKCFDDAKKLRDCDK